ncbi:hypothetical protein ASG43_06140 [Aureimonas sp. Leaf454]|uniref:hypothetical protein n=1 Tax=Aureimonas sp. Leaf454 TaxID=1736381 RepID=UPI0007018A0C|nr:hypothetical protein [Aureimonas sp. Leaf454]KQT50839.1 hypothetical protein ASG43_06140 [Aureimonas sp. Leaf454]
MIAANEEALPLLQTDGDWGTGPATKLAGIAAAGSLALLLAASFWPVDAQPRAALAFALPPSPLGDGRGLSAAPFDPLRRPAAGVEPLPISPDPQSSAASSALLPPPPLAGLLAGEDVPKVLFSLSGEGWKRRGDVVLGWTVQGISETSVRLRRGEEHVTLPFRDALLSR